MIQWSDMDSKRDSTDGRPIRGIRVSDEDWEAVQRLAGELGCTRAGGGPSVAMMLSDLANGAFTIKRRAAGKPQTKAARIRAVIKRFPTATNVEVAETVGADALYVLQVRRRTELAKVKGKADPPG